MDRFPETEKISPPLLQLNDVTFGYTPNKILLKKVNIDIGLDSRMAVIGANGAGAYWHSQLSVISPHERGPGKSTLIKLLIGELEPLSGHVTRNGRLRMFVVYLR